VTVEDRRIACVREPQLKEWSQHAAIQRAIGLSIALHAVLMLAIRAGPFAMSTPGVAPEWHLRIAEAADRVAEHGVVAPARRRLLSPADPTPAPVDDRANDLRPLESTSQTNAVAAQPSAMAGDDAETIDKVDAPAAAPDANEVLTTTAVQSTLSVPVVVGRAMTSTEREMVARRIKDWSGKIRDPEQVPTSMTWREKDRQYTAEFVRHPATSVTDLERVDVVVSTEENGRSLRSRLQLMRLAFSQFAQLVDQWDPSMQLHDDEIYGRFHSNSEILLGRDDAVIPRFFGQVTTTTGYKIVSGQARRFREEAFQGGLDTHAQHILMPRQLALSASRSAAEAENVQRREFDVDTQIVFNADGSYSWRGLNEADTTEKREQIGSGPVYLLAARGVRLQVRGTVRGTVLVYSPAQIDITGNLTYARHFLNADDYLGLISERDIVVADPKVTGRGDLEISAAIYARGWFRINDIDSGGKAVLTINGSLSAGSVAASEPRYAFRIKYDRRFERVRPPGFPMTGRYELQQEEARWDAADSPDSAASAAPFAPAVPTPPAAAFR
jgi:hypothetical protein